MTVPASYCVSRLSGFDGLAVRLVVRWPRCPLACGDQAWVNTWSHSAAEQAREVHSAY